MLLPQQTYFQRTFLITCALFWLCRYTALPAVFPLIAAVSAVLTALSRIVPVSIFPVTSLPEQLLALVFLFCAFLSFRFKSIVILSYFYCGCLAKSL